jgi:flagellar biogenesis protein FliO
MMHSETSESVGASESAWPARWFAALSSLVRSLRITRRDRTLRVCETLPLGDKRFLAVVQCEGRRFLIGGTHHSISLLDRLDPAAKPQSRRDALRESFFSGVH